MTGIPMSEGQFKERWSQLHGGADVKGVVGGWLRFSYQAARVCAALRISPNFLTFSLLRWHRWKRCDCAWKRKQMGIYS